MKRCEVCGHQSDRTFTLKRDGMEHTFDSFECAIQALAPQCPHCGCRVIGHGVEWGRVVYCCSHCAESHEAHANFAAPRSVAAHSHNGSLVAVLQSPE